jgi:TonB family protein
MCGQFVWCIYIAVPIVQNRLALLCALQLTCLSASVFAQDAPATSCDTYAASDHDTQRKGVGVPFANINPALAVPACETAVRQYPNNSRLIYQLGRAYFKANNLLAAATQFHRAADQGYAAAQYNLGVMYQNGQGVSQAFTQGVARYRQGADQGNAEAQNNLGTMYDMGQGVPQDYAQAIAWYRKAADQGLATARGNLIRAQQRNAPKSISDWNSELVATLSRNKRYPTEALTNKEQGVVIVSFTVDRSGKLLNSRINQTSGSDALDQAAIDLLKRAQPFPPLPSSYDKTQITLSLPIRFSLAEGTATADRPSLAPEFARLLVVPDLCHDIDPSGFAHNLCYRTLISQIPALIAYVQARPLLNSALQPPYGDLLREFNQQGSNNRAPVDAFTRVSMHASSYLTGNYRDNLERYSKWLPFSVHYDDQDRLARLKAAYDEAFSRDPEEFLGLQGTFLKKALKGRRV